MKKIAFIATLTFLLFSAVNADAQIRQDDYDLKEFTSIVVGADFEVTVEEDNEYKASVTIDRQFKDCLVCSVSGNVLNINLDEKKLTKDVKKFIKSIGTDKPAFSAVVYVPGDLKEITLKDQAVLNCTKELGGESVRVNVTDNAVLKAASVKSQFANIVTDKKGKASLIAVSDGVTVSSTGTSALTLTQSCRNSDITVSGFSNVVLDGEVDNITINAKGTCKAEIKGKALSANYNINGGCSINAHELESEDAVVKISGLSTLSESASKTLSLDLQGGASLTYDKQPSISIVGIKLSTVKMFTESEK